jgi:hypothetical protein
MKKLSIVASVAAVLALQSVAYAQGFHSTSLISVYKSSSGSSAYGSMQSARYYATDNVEYIGCLSASDTVSSIYVTCAARDAHNTVVTCYSTTADGQARQAVSSVNQTSSIYFAANSAGKCTYISIGNYSFNL